MPTLWFWKGRDAGNDPLIKDLSKGLSQTVLGNSRPLLVHRTSRKELDATL